MREIKSDAVERVLAPFRYSCLSMQFQNNTFRRAQTNLIGLLRLQVNNSASELAQNDGNAGSPAPSSSQSSAV